MRRPLHYKLDERGTPVPVITVKEDGTYDDAALIDWARWMEDFEHRSLLRTEVEPGTWVSTVFLGTDHNFWYEGDPILWETMVWSQIEPVTMTVFGKQVQRDRHWWDIQERYRSESAARDGHAMVVEEVKRRLAEGKPDREPEGTR